MQTKPLAGPITINPVYAEDNALSADIANLPVDIPIANYNNAPLKKTLYKWLEAMPCYKTKKDESQPKVQLPQISEWSDDFLRITLRTFALCSDIRFNGAKLSQELKTALKSIADAEFALIDSPYRSKSAKAQVLYNLISIYGIIEGRKKFIKIKHFKHPMCGFYKKGETKSKEFVKFIQNIVIVRWASKGLSETITFTQGVIDDALIDLIAIFNRRFGITAAVNKNGFEIVPDHFIVFKDLITLTPKAFAAKYPLNGSSEKIKLQNAAYNLFLSKRNYGRAAIANLAERFYVSPRKRSLGSRKGLKDPVISLYNDLETYLWQQWPQKYKLVSGRGKGARLNRYSLHPSGRATDFEVRIYDEKKKRWRRINLPESRQLAKNIRNFINNNLKAKFGAFDTIEYINEYDPKERQGINSSGNHMHIGLRPKPEKYVGKK